MPRPAIVRKTAAALRVLPNPPLGFEEARRALAEIAKLLQQPEAL